MSWRDDHDYAEDGLWGEGYDFSFLEDIPSEEEYEEYHSSGWSGWEDDYDGE